MGNYKVPGAGVRVLAIFSMAQLSSAMPSIEHPKREEVQPLCKVLETESGKGVICSAKWRNFGEEVLNSGTGAPRGLCEEVQGAWRSRACSSGRGEPICGHGGRIL